LPHWMATAPESASYGTPASSGGGAAATAGNAVANPSARTHPAPREVRPNGA